MNEPKKLMDYEIKFVCFGGNAGDLYTTTGATFAAAFDKYKEACGMKPGLVYMWTNNNNLPEKVWVGPYSTRWEGCDPEAYDSRPILIQDNRPAKLRRKHQHAIGEPMGQ